MFANGKNDWMKSAGSKFLAPGIVTLAMAAATPSFGQTGLSQSDFAQALRAIPRVLQVGHSGLPTIGRAARAEASTIFPAAETASAEWSRSRTGYRGIHRIAQSMPAAAPQGCPAPTEADGKPMIGFKVEFEFGSAQLKPVSLETLRNLGKALNEDLTDQNRFEIEGHTDAVGSLSYNEQLSMARAEAVKEFLIRDVGVAPERLAVSGKGFCELADPNHPYGAANRRVVVLNQSS
jgi:outer membrane protein OmpA-like peptidoglycan-associated protein